MKSLNFDDEEGSGVDVTDNLDLITKTEEPGMNNRLAPIRYRIKHPGIAVYRPPELYAMFKSYVDFMQDRKLYRSDVVKSGPCAGDSYDTALQAPLTLESFLLYCSLSSRKYNELKKNPDYEAVCDAIDMAIRTNNFEYAACGLLHPGLVARKIGLTDTKPVDDEPVLDNDVPVISFSFHQTSGPKTEEPDFTDLK